MLCRNERGRASRKIEEQDGEHAVDQDCLLLGERSAEEASD